MRGSIISVVVTRSAIETAASSADLRAAYRLRRARWQSGEVLLPMLRLAARRGGTAIGAALLCLLLRWGREGQLRNEQGGYTK